MPTNGFRLVLATLVATAVIASGGRAEASIISIDSTFNPDPDVLINNNGNICTGDTTTSAVSSTDCKSLEFTYTIAGFNPATDSMDSGTLTLTFYDDNTPGPDQGGNHSESVNISLDGVLNGESPLLITNGTTSGSPFSHPFDVLAELQNGVLTVVLSLPTGSEGNNDFYFAESRLVARGQTGTSVQTPEPTALFLFGTALFGLAAHGRRRNRR